MDLAVLIDDALGWIGRHAGRTGGGGQIQKSSLPSGEIAIPPFWAAVLTNAETLSLGMKGGFYRAGGPKFSLGNAPIDAS